MRTLAGLILAAWVVIAGVRPAAAQTADILAGAPPTGVYVETVYTDDHVGTNCDFYAAAGVLTESLTAGSDDVTATPALP